MTILGNTNVVLRRNKNNLLQIVIDTQELVLQYKKIHMHSFIIVRKNRSMHI